MKARLDRHARREKARHQLARLLWPWGALAEAEKRILRLEIEAEAWRIRAEASDEGAATAQQLWREEQAARSVECCASGRCEVCTPGWGWGW